MLEIFEVFEAHFLIKMSLMKRSVLQGQISICNASRVSILGGKKRLIMNWYSFVDHECRFLMPL